MTKAIITAVAFLVAAPACAQTVDLTSAANQLAICAVESNGSTEVGYKEASQEAANEAGLDWQNVWASALHNAWGDVQQDTDNCKQVMLDYPALRNTFGTIWAKQKLKQQRQKALALDTRGAPTTMLDLLVCYSDASDMLDVDLVNSIFKSAAPAQGMSKSLAVAYGFRWALQVAAKRRNISSAQLNQLEAIIRRSTGQPSSNNRLERQSQIKLCMKIVKADPGLAKGFQVGASHAKD